MGLASLIFLCFYGVRTRSDNVFSGDCCEVLFIDPRREAKCRWKYLGYNCKADTGHVLWQSQQTTPNTGGGKAHSVE